MYMYNVTLGMNLRSDVIPGHIQSPVGILASTSSFPYLKEKELTVRIRADWIGFRILDGDPARSQPHQALPVQRFAGEDPVIGTNPQGWG